MNNHIHLRGPFSSLNKKEHHLPSIKINELDQHLSELANLKAYALSLGASEEQIAHFSNAAQIAAFAAHVPYNQSLDFNDMLQVTAYQEGMSLEQALSVTNIGEIFTFIKEN